MPVRTTRKQYDRFVSKVYGAWDAVGMDGWQLIVRLADLNADIAAQTEREYFQRRIVITMNSHIAHKHSTAFWDDMAVHEVAHAVLAPLGELAKMRFIDDGDLDAAEHEVVRRLIPMIENATRRPR